MLEAGDPRTWFQTKFSEEDLTRQRVTICVQPVRRKSKDNVAAPDPAAIDHFRAVNHADDAARKVVLAFAVHARHLGGLTANQRALRSPARFREPGQQLIEDARLQLLRADAAQAEKRARAQDRDVVYAMV